MVQHQFVIFGGCCCEGSLAESEKVVEWLTVRQRTKTVSGVLAVVMDKFCVGPRCGLHVVRCAAVAGTSKITQHVRCARDGQVNVQLAYNV